LIYDFIMVGILKFLFKNSIIFILTTILSVCCILQNGYGQKIQDVSSSPLKKTPLKSGKDTQLSLNKVLNIIDDYIDKDWYDSAQIWLYVADELTEGIVAQKDNYLIAIRQAEVYYYSGLQRLGLEEAKQALLLAQSLQDSMLMADAYNFCGLFQANTNNNRLAIAHFEAAIRFFPKHHHISSTDLISLPYHIYGNMAEAYYKLKVYDTALHYAQQSLQESETYKSIRGQVLAMIMEGNIFNKTLRYDAALMVMQKALDKAKQQEIWDAVLLGYSGLATTYTYQNNKQKAFEMIDSGFALIAKHPIINLFFKSLFYEEAREVHATYNNYQEQIKVYHAQLELSKERALRNDSQIDFILAEGLKNKTKLLELEVKDVKQREKNTYLTFFVILMMALIIIIILVYYRYLQAEKLKTSEIRRKLSQDLHDDIGASLSSLQIYGTIAAQTLHTHPAKAQDMLQRITNRSQEIMNTMDDIVWSMQEHVSGTRLLSERIKNYGADVLHEKNIAVEYEIQPEAEQQLTSVLLKKNIWLIFKEAMNNMAKYSQATQAEISFKIKDHKLYLMIADNGVGIENLDTVPGNGLVNMQKRMKELNGIITIENNNGLKIYGSCPIKT
jgi:signal transduction histidine kinase